MQFSALKTELANRGFARLLDSQLGVFINRAMHELDDAEYWPYRRTSTSGAAPLTIADLGLVQQAFTTIAGIQTPLVRRSYDDLVNDVGDVTLTGSLPWFWYKSAPTVVNVFPAGTGSITVEYWKVAADLSGSSDTPLAPDRFQGLIVDIAERMAHEMKNDRQMAAAVQASVEAGMLRMRIALLDDDQPSEQAISYASEDW